MLYIGQALDLTLRTTQHKKNDKVGLYHQTVQKTKAQMIGVISMYEVPDKLLEIEGMTPKTCGNVIEALFINKHGTLVWNDESKAFAFNVLMPASIKSIVFMFQSIQNNHHKDEDLMNFSKYLLFPCIVEQFTKRLDITTTSWPLRPSSISSQQIGTPTRRNHKWIAAQHWFSDFKKLIHNFIQNGNNNCVIQSICIKCERVFPSRHQCQSPDSMHFSLQNTTLIAAKLYQQHGGKCSIDTVENYNKAMVPMHVKLAIVKHTLLQTDDFTQELQQLIQEYLEKTPLATKEC